MMRLKAVLRGMPFSRYAFKLIRMHKTRSNSRGVFKRRDWRDNDDEAEIHRLRILNVLDFTKTSGTYYAAVDYIAGYHEISIGGKTFAGQRKPQERLSKVPFDFRGKTVLDIGCNQGGMLFALRDHFKWAVGIDFDHRMINACNLIKREERIDNASFFVFDVDREPHGLIKDFLPECRVNVVFLLSVCMWIKRWRDIISFCADIADVVVFEANGTARQQTEQIDFLKQRFQRVDLLAEKSDDDNGQKNRQLVIASHK